MENKQIEMILVPKKAYEELLEQSHWLGCLEEAGVDNWSGISFANELYEEEYGEEE